MFGLFKKKKPVAKKRASKRREFPKTQLNEALKQLSTKSDVQIILKEITQSRDAVIQEVTKLPESLSTHLVDQITAPLREFFQSELSHVPQSQQLSINQAIKQVNPQKLSSNQAVKQQKSFDDVISEMKERVENLSQRHLKVINILIQNRDGWLEYEDIGKYCNPQLTGSCIRGYVADLINSYKIPIEKKIFGRKSKVKISPQGLKQLALSKMVD